MARLAGSRRRRPWVEVTPEPEYDVQRAILYGLLGIGLGAVLVVAAWIALLP